MIRSMYARRADLVARLIERYTFDIDCTVTKEGCTLLGLAAILGEKDIIEHLIRAGANPNQKDLNQRTAFTYACMMDNRRAMDKLIDGGAVEEILDEQGNLPWSFIS